MNITPERRLEQRLARLEVLAVQAETERQMEAFKAETALALMARPLSRLRDVLALSKTVWGFAAQVDQDLRNAKRPPHARWRLT